MQIAINKVNEVLQNQSPIYCLGELVHNKTLLQNFEKKGMITVHSIQEVPENEMVIIRTHGETPNTYQKAAQKNAQIIDLTCSNVKVIHEKVKQKKANSFVIIIGEKNHPEVIGTLGFAGKDASVVENETDILACYQAYKKTKLNLVYVVSQTTFSSQRFEQLASQIRKTFHLIDIKIDKTICHTTQNRQLEAIKLAKQSTVMLVIGGKDSSNTKKLYELASQYCQKTFHIQTSKELNHIIVEENDEIGLITGASTPENIVNEIKYELERKYKSCGNSKKLARL